MNSKAFSQWLRSRARTVNIDPNLLAHSRVARTSRRLLHAAAVVNALIPLLTLVALLSLNTISVMAQGPSGGTIFGGNDQTLGNGVREAIKWGRNLLFLLGVGGLMWSALNYMTEKNWTKQALGGIFCFAFGSIASLAYSFSQGSAVNLDTELAE